MILPPPPSVTAQRTRKSSSVVQWRRRHVREGLLVVDQAQLAKLVKRDPIDKYYSLDPEPFATGQFACVRRCRSLETGQVFAAKFSSRTRYGEDCSAEIRNEIALLSLCAPSPRIVRLHDVFETTKEIIIVLEYAPGGDLQTIIDDNLVPFESDVVKFVKQLLEGLVYLHERRIAHLDIKPQNLVMMSQFPDCDVKLCDFEISRVIVEGAEIREILGTPDYVAPEILHYEPITLASDMWSLGVTTYVLLTGFSPFGGETDQETFCNIAAAQLDFPEELFEDVSQAAQDFIRSLLVRDPKARPTAKECLRHRWISTAKNRTSKPKDNGGLRKYLSKSREALFERVVQQSNNLRKSTLLSQQRRRLCESHASLLVSKTRTLTDYHPSLSRSREKLYGLRSLSRSQEALRASNRSLCADDNAEQRNNNGVEPPPAPTPPPPPPPQPIATPDLPERVDDNVPPAPAPVTPTPPPPPAEDVPTAASESGSSDGEEVSSSATSQDEADGDGEGEDEENAEPRFTVAQLISAFNRHQEAVTKTSLEVTMTSPSDRLLALAAPGSKFPTGPNALRLFIPDISIRSGGRRKKQQQQEQLTNGAPQEPQAEVVSKVIAGLRADDINNNIVAKSEMAWERLCTGSYSRAMDKLHRRNSRQAL